MPMDEQCAGSVTGLAIALAASDDQQGTVKEFRKALAMGPTNTGHQRNLAFALVRLGESTDPIGYLERVVASTPNDSGALTILRVFRKPVTQPLWQSSRLFSIQHSAERGELENRPSRQTLRR